ncbi:uncharacterized protein LOC129567531 [Sitodiplosis mosellana]|uniref:uncharacterized protein LOC129567531 n=1 Tax=Sitodiplosis mosellana TaxID=263140 RepID=UPI0024438268|nr:uncharacterized protein LOC129567531 [Sitodiplosis mosellana]
MGLSGDLLGTLTVFEGAIVKLQSDNTIEVELPSNDGQRNTILIARDIWMHMVLALPNDLLGLPTFDGVEFQQPNAIENITADRISEENEEVNNDHYDGDAEEESDTDTEGSSDDSYGPTDSPNKRDAALFALYHGQ